MPKKDYLQGAVDHFKHQEIRVVEVEEWNLVGDDAIYVKPFTLLEKSEIFKDNINDLTLLIDIIVKKAETKSGEKMFDLESKIKMKKFVDPDIIGRVATEILGTQSTVQDLKKK
tara:strand:- start:462 stop:803 length:342 start_codon:yes stop_codon:yes gene_type:complete